MVSSLSRHRGLLWLFRIANQLNELQQTQKREGLRKSKPSFSEFGCIHMMIRLFLSLSGSVFFMAMKMKPIYLPIKCQRVLRVFEEWKGYDSSLSGELMSSGEERHNDLQGGGAKDSYIFNVGE